MDVGRGGPVPSISARLIDVFSFDDRTVVGSAETAPFAMRYDAMRPALLCFVMPRKKFRYIICGVVSRKDKLIWDFAGDWKYYCWMLMERWSDGEGGKS